MIISPFFTPIDKRDKCSAAVPLLQTRACFEPKYFLKLFSSLETKDPCVNVLRSKDFFTLLISLFDID